MPASSAAARALRALVLGFVTADAASLRSTLGRWYEGDAATPRTVASPSILHSALHSSSAHHVVAGAVAGRVESGAELDAQENSRATAFDQAVSSAYQQLLEGGSTLDASRRGIGPLVEQAAKAMDLELAERVVALPPQVARVLSAAKSREARKKNGGKQEPGAQMELEGNSAAEAVEALNKMVTAAQTRLDGKAIECKSFKQKNRETYAQVQADLTRFGQVVADHARSHSRALAGIEEATLNSQQTLEEIEQAEVMYNRTKAVDEKQLVTRHADLGSTKELLDITKCPDAPADPAAPAFLQRSNFTAFSTVVETCEEAGAQTFMFKDARLEARMQKLSPRARQLMELSMTRAANSNPSLAAVLSAAGMAMSGRNSADLEDGTDDEPQPEDAEEFVRPRADRSPRGMSARGVLHNMPKGPGGVVGPLGRSYPSGPLGRLAARLGAPQAGPVSYGLHPNFAPKGSAGNTAGPPKTFAERLREERQRRVEDMIAKDFHAPKASANSLFGHLFAPAFEQQSPSEGTPMPSSISVTPPPSELADSQRQSRKCVSAEPDCGDIHDTFAAIWGDMRDLVEETIDNMRKNDVDMRELETRANMQLQSFSTQKGELQSLLAEATSTMATEVEAQTQKEAQAEQLEKTYRRTMKECKATVKQIMFVELCGIMKVRNAIMQEMDIEAAIDCEVSDWVSGVCSMPCDDDLIGGNLTLTRESITLNNANGAHCPALSMTTVCNQKRCPINCVNGEWSAWSRCTKGCGGGVQSRTRPNIQQARNGGRACDALQESQPCNSGSCDVDCQLSDWTPFGACSQACDRGYSERVKSVVARTVGAGRCPKSSSVDRYEKQECNAEGCIGDERCIVKMDLVIAIDGSGSLTEAGFNIMKTFVAELLPRLAANAYGREAMRVALVQFGNGRMDSDDVISDAIVVAQLESDMAQLVTKVEGLTWQKGFTNMAQAFLKARDVLGGSLRSDAPRTVLLLTDGRPTFRAQTMAAVHSLKESSRLVVLQVKSFPSDGETRLMHNYASTPWRTNFIHVPGKRALRGAMDDYVTKVVAQLCPNAESPSANRMRAELVGFELVREGASCGPGAASSVEMSLENCKLYADSLAAPLAGPDPSSAVRWSAFAFSEEGNCVIYETACADYERNTTYNVYEPVMTAQQRLIAGP